MVVVKNKKESEVLPPGNRLRSNSRYNENSYVFFQG
jgi:hypothetical protein